MSMIRLLLALLYLLTLSPIATNPTCDPQSCPDGSTVEPIPPHCDPLQCPPCEQVQCFTTPCYCITCDKFDCGEDPKCAIGESLVVPEGRCCEICQKDCTRVLCPVAVCAPNEELVKPEGECCSICQAKGNSGNGGGGNGGNGGNGGKTCPEPTGFGICVELCGPDGSCPKGELCCSNGCGHVCMTPVKAKEGDSCDFCTMSLCPCKLCPDGINTEGCCGACEYQRIDGKLQCEYKETSTGCPPSAHAEGANLMGAHQMDEPIRRIHALFLGLFVIAVAVCFCHYCAFKKCKGTKYRYFQEDLEEVVTENDEECMELNV